MKIAADYGFKVENNGLANAYALQEAVKGGGDIYIDKPGVYEIADQILLDDDTSLYFCGAAIFFTLSISLAPFHAPSIFQR